MSYADHIRRIRARLREPLPGPDVQLTMAPAYRNDPSMLRVEGKPCREAAVLVLLQPIDGQLHLTLTVRPDHLRHHGGQVAFAGGRREPGEALVRTALREAEEEIALAEDAAEVLGPLTPLYIPPSNFCVHPFIAAAAAPLTLAPSDDEVAALLHVPLDHLLATETRRERARTIGGQALSVPYFDVEGYEVWGATAMMLAEVLAVLSESRTER